MRRRYGRRILISLRTSMMLSVLIATLAVIAFRGLDVWDLEGSAECSIEDRVCVEPVAAVATRSRAHAHRAPIAPVVPDLLADERIVLIDRADRTAHHQGDRRISSK